MNKEFPLNTLTFNGQRFGLSWTINFPIFFAKFKEISGVDLQPIVIPLLVRLVKSEVENLQKAKNDGRLIDGCASYSKQYIRHTFQTCKRNRPIST